MGAFDKFTMDCDCCGQKFGSEAQLSEHQASGCIGGCDCPDCGQKFGSQEELVQHVAKVHPESGLEELPDCCCFRLAYEAQMQGQSKEVYEKEFGRRTAGLKPEEALAGLPPELWKMVWGRLDDAFFPDGKHPEIHMNGACKCGKCNFKVDGKLAVSMMCHCHMCRRYWSEQCPTHTIWVWGELTMTKGKEFHSSYHIPKLSRNLRGTATVNFCTCCGTKTNVLFGDPSGGKPFTLLWPGNFLYEEWGNVSGKGDKARHGYAEVLRPRFHAHYENRSVDVEDTLPKLADIWVDNMPVMNNKGEVTGKMQYPMPGFENGFLNAPAIEATLDGSPGSKFQKAASGGSNGSISLSIDASSPKMTIEISKL